MAKHTPEPGPRPLEFYGALALDKPRETRLLTEGADFLEAVDEITLKGWPKLKYLMEDWYLQRQTPPHIVVA